MDDREYVEMFISYGHVTADDKCCYCGCNLKEDKSCSFCKVKELDNNNNEV